VTILVTGFGPFPGVTDNPSGRLADAVDGARVGDDCVVGRTLPVTYADAGRLTVRWAREERATLIVGLGVSSRRGVQVECVGRPRCAADRPDASGRSRDEWSGTEVRQATLDTRLFAAALGASLSDDAGDYVCNAWLFDVLGGVDVPAAFVHIPVLGLAPEVLLHALEAIYPGPTSEFS
jgi:pyroglutamyl-peptidase